MSHNKKYDYDETYNKDYDTIQAVTSVVGLGGNALGLLGMGIAGINQHRASKIIQSAKDEYESARRSYEQVSNSTRHYIQDVVNLKKQIMKDQMKTFLHAYKRLHPQIVLKKSAGLKEVERFAPEKQDFEDLRRSANVYARYNEERLGGRASNVALIMVQDGTVERIADHIKNIQIAAQIKDSDLKRNRLDELKIEGIDILAEFSAASIEFAVSGITDAISSIREVNEAKRCAVQYRDCAEQLKLKEIKMDAIWRYAEVHSRLLKRCRKVLGIYVPRTIKIIEQKDNFFRIGRIKPEKFTQDELSEMAFTFSLIKAVKAIIDSPIIALNGEVYTGNSSNFEEAQEFILISEKSLVPME